MTLSITRRCPRRFTVGGSFCSQIHVDTFINTIFPHNDKPVLTFNFKGGTKTISFSGIKEVIDKKEAVRI